MVVFCASARQRASASFEADADGAGNTQACKASAAHASPQARMITFINNAPGLNARPKEGRRPRLSIARGHRHDNVADVLLGQEDLLRRRKLAQWKGLCQHGQQGVLFDEPYNALHGP